MDGLRLVNSIIFDAEKVALRHEHSTSNHSGNRFISVAYFSIGKPCDSIQLITD
jgi:hypothetical protein